MKISSEKRWVWSLLVLLLGITVLIYWRVIFLPFISDDWWFLRQIQNSGIAGSLKRSFDPNNKTVYAPLGEAFMTMMYKIFGFNPFPMRFPNLIIHVFNSCLVIFIIGHIVENNWIGILSGIVYTSAVAIHLDIFAWAWAAYGDMGGTCFFLLSIWMYLKGKIWPSAFLYLLGCLFKPTIIFLPALLVLHSFALPGEGKPDFHLGRLFVKWIPFLIFGGLVVGLKLIGGVPTNYEENQPYFIDFWGKHLVTNAESYLTWMFQSIVPVNSSETTIFKAIEIISFSVFLTGTVAALLAIKRDKAFWRILILLGWLVVGILTVYFLPNHTYRYYSIYSLPAFIALYFYSFQYTLETIKLNHRIGSIILSFIGLFAAIGSIYQSNLMFDEKLKQNIFADGTNMLIRRAATVEFVVVQLQEDFPTMPSGLVLVLGGADLGSFSNNSTLHYLYNDDTVDFYLPSEISFENGDWHLHTLDSDPQYVDPSLVVVYELKEDGVVRLDLADLQKPSVGQ